MFVERLQRCWPALSAEQVSLLESHFRLLQRWNRVLNLTAITDEDEAAERHYCESLFLAGVLPSGPHRIVDIGAGAGFPGLPVAVLRPDCSVTLVESHQRKAVFLREASRDLPNVRVIAQRAEAVVRQPGNEAFDWAISRAVSYSDLTGVLSRLAGKAALLTGSDVPPPELGFLWEPPVALPWGNQRFLRVGQLGEKVWPKSSP